MYSGTKHVLRYQTKHVLRYQTKHVLRYQTKHVLRYQTKHVLRYQTKYVLGYQTCAQVQNNLMEKTNLCKTNLCPAIGPIALQRYMINFDALGDASWRREPSAMNHHSQEGLVYV